MRDWRTPAEISEDRRARPWLLAQAWILGAFQLGALGYAAWTLVG
jgi:demethoxyubiquinone hydroxylase (CLK1/Coq7/Cat5 family)